MIMEILAIIVGILLFVYWITPKKGFPRYKNPPPVPENNNWLPEFKHGVEPPAKPKNKGRFVN